MTNQASIIKAQNVALAAFRLLTAVVVCFAVSAHGQGQQPAARPLPAGDGKAIVETACTACHELTLITTAGHTPADWKLLVERMVSAGAEVPKNQIAMVTEYLSKNFPEGNVPKAVILPGAAKVSFKEWTVPTVGSRPHDPLATHDGYHLVLRPVRERARPRRSQDRRDQGISSDHARLGPARPGRG